jgi:hypothetical protein
MTTPRYGTVAYGQGESFVFDHEQHRPLSAQEAAGMLNELRARVAELQLQLARDEKRFEKYNQTAEVHWIEELV